MADITYLDTPVGELEYVIISGKGKLDLKGVPKYNATVVLSAEEAAPFIAKIDSFWEDVKPKGGKAKSMGYYPHTVKDKEASEEAGEPVYVPTGKIAIQAKTGIAYQSGDAKIIKIFNAKGNEVSLQGKKIGNGSRGRLGIGMALYDVNPSARGVTLYLNSIQISKFIEYTGGDSFDSIEDEEGGDFDGVDNDGMSAMSEEEAATPAKPRL
jgi:hypothetical protein